MNTDDLTPANYDYARGITRSLSTAERLGLFTIVAINGAVLWYLFPGYTGLLLGGGMGLVAALGIVGEVWRQFEIRVLGLDAGPGEGGGE